MSARRALVIGCGLSVIASLLSAQPPGTRPPAAARGLRVYLITVGQGEYVWEKFGHNALWFLDDAGGVDEAYNWGVFDFNQPGFLRRFLTGDTRYWVERYPGQLLIDYYKNSDRTVVVQRLNLAVDQASRALAYARWNAREENKYYRYDYFRDNCSTRVRDLINRALGGSLKRSYWEIPAPVTYKSESVRLVDDMPFTQLGIYTALGEPADRPISLWHLMFIPMRLRDVIRGERVVGPMGQPIPLVAEERTLYTSRAHHERANPPRLWMMYLVIGLALAGEFAAVGVTRSRSRLADRVFRIEVAVWSGVNGFCGLVLLLAWLTTRHVFWFRNENLLLLNPLSLWLAVVTVLSLTRPRFTRQAAIVSAIIAAAGLVALAVKATPLFPQDNLALILLFAPAHIAIAFGLRRASPAPVEHAALDRR